VSSYKKCDTDILVCDWRFTEKMKQIIFVTVFLSLFFTVGTVDARWIPENATSEDIDRLIQMEKEDKEKIIKEQYLKKHKIEQKKEKEGQNVTTEGMIEKKGERGKEGREISPQVLSSDAQQQVVSGISGISGVSTPEQKTSITGQEEGKAAGIAKPIEIKKPGWKDWLIIGLFLFISIGSLIFYFYSINKINKKITDRRITSKGITLVEILIATVIVAISILCILKAFQQSSLIHPHTGEASKAITLCQEKLEEIRSMPYGSLTVGTIEQQKISMPPYGWNGNTPINGGATRSVTIKKIKEEGSPPTFEETDGAFDYLKATVKMEWGTTPLKRELSVFIAERP